MITLGYVIAIGLPLAVIVGVVLWPERIPPERTVSAIQQRIKSENSPHLFPQVGGVSPSRAGGS